MANSNLTTNSYHSLNALDMSIRAFVELAHVLPDEDSFTPLLLILADRIESDFTAMRNDAIVLWREPEEKDDE
ncbi:hypothetical protein ACVVI8_004835 [Escherichia coli]